MNTCCWKWSFQKSNTRKKPKGRVKVILLINVKYHLLDLSTVKICPSKQVGDIFLPKLLTEFSNEIMTWNEILLEEIQFYIFPEEQNKLVPT